MARETKPFEMTLKELIGHPDEAVRSRAFHLMHRLETICFIENQRKVPFSTEFPPVHDRDVRPALTPA